jgi:hypothetical protein
MTLKMNKKTFQLFAAYIKVNPEATIEQIIKYLKLKLSEKDEKKLILWDSKK